MTTTQQSGDQKPVAKRSTSETGHPINLSSFEKLIEHVKTLGKDYQPSNKDLELLSLQKKYEEAKAALDQSDQCEADFDIATDNRSDLYGGLKPLGLSILSNFRSTKVAESAKEAAQTVYNKLSGRPSKLKKKDVLVEGEEAAQTVSNSQQSYVQLAQHFKDLNKVVAGHPEYAPNEKQLQLASLDQMEKDLDRSNTIMSNAISTWAAARRTRNKIYYQEETGLVKTAKLVKDYVLSVYKSHSPEYKTINNIPFRTIKNKKDNPA